MSDGHKICPPLAQSAMGRPFACGYSTIWQQQEMTASSRAVRKRPDFTLSLLPSPVPLYCQLAYHLLSKSPLHSPFNTTKSSPSALADTITTCIQPASNGRFKRFRQPPYIIAIFCSPCAQTYHHATAINSQKLSHLRHSLSVFLLRFLGHTNRHPSPTPRTIKAQIETLAALGPEGLGGTTWRSPRRRAGCRTLWIVIKSRRRRSMASEVEC